MLKLVARARTLLFKLWDSYRISNKWYAEKPKYCTRAADQISKHTLLTVITAWVLTVPVILPRLRHSSI
jgi:hypothetical protein